ncbi:hypothetical protein, partial [Megasphaera stantonii]|uniref:hypothetical protein n=1 Tax=Megasphaera stantonii TaxID=2144175 RepID=UPI001300309B
YMTVIEFKDKIEIRLTYDGMRFDCEKEKIEWYKNVKEVFALNIKDERADWKQIVEGLVVGETAIGYYTDVKEMWQKNALSFCHYRRIITSGNLTILLRK